MYDEELTLPTGTQKITKKDVPNVTAQEGSVATVQANDVVVSLPTMLTLAEVEQRHITAVLKAVNGNKTHAAKVLGVSLRTVYNKLESYQTDS